MKKNIAILILGFSCFALLILCFYLSIGLKKQKEAARKNLVTVDSIRAVLIQKEADEKLHYEMAQTIFLKAKEEAEKLAKEK